MHCIIYRPKIFCAYTLHYPHGLWPERLDTCPDAQSYETHSPGAPTATGNNSSVYTVGSLISYGIRKFYGNFNNVMSVVGYYRNEIATLHLIRSYCTPTVLYGCETWYLDRYDYRRLNVFVE